LRCELDEKEDEIDDLMYRVERLEKELKIEKGKDTDKEKQETRIQGLERDLAHEKARNTELAKAKTHLDKVHKQWANMAKLFLGQDQHVGVDASGDDEMPKNEEVEVTVVEY
jgi:predicted RNase H-like nuclease (RuvC/YqgF family)